MGQRKINFSQITAEIFSVNDASMLAFLNKHSIPFSFNLDGSFNLFD